MRRLSAGGIIIKLVLFFTTGMSLRKWAHAGILKREIKLYNELAKDMDRIYLLTYGDKRDLNYTFLLADNIEVLPDRFGLGVLYSLLAPIIHRRALAGADYYKTNQMNGSHTAVIAKILYKKKLVVRQGYPWLKTLKEKKASTIKVLIATITEKLAYRYADKIIVTTEQQKQEIILNYGYADKISVIPNCVDTKVFKPREHPPEFKKYRKRLVYVGRLAPEKNLVNLIEAVKSLGVELIIVGAGEQRQTLKQKIKNEGITNVRLWGAFEYEVIPDILNTADVYVQPSLYEGQPKTILEAMSCGLPVVGSDVRGIRDVIKDGENGYLCGTSADSIKETIIRALSDGANVGACARKDVLGKYSLCEVLKKEKETFSQSPHSATSGACSVRDMGNRLTRRHR